MKVMRIKKLHINQDLNSTKELLLDVDSVRLLMITEINSQLCELTIGICTTTDEIKNINILYNNKEDCYVAYNSIIGSI